MGPNRSQRISWTEKAACILPVGRIHRKLKERKFANRISDGAAVYLTGVLDYLATEVMELAGTAATQNRKKRIGPNHITLAVRNDPELSEVWSNVIVPQGGVIPNIRKEL